jgi:hypothetical protein
VLVATVGISWRRAPRRRLWGRLLERVGDVVGESVALTPDATTISFSPWSSTRIRATPVDPSRRATR